MARPPPRVDGHKIVREEAQDYVLSQGLTVQVQLEGERTRTGPGPRSGVGGGQNGVVPHVTLPSPEQVQEAVVLERPPRQLRAVELRQARAQPGHLQSPVGQLALR